MGFQTPQHSLKTLLDWTTSGKIQLPDFQRGYKWEDERIRQLLVTILRGHPLGVVLLLAADNEQIRFKPRTIEGVENIAVAEAEWLLLDGQQRLTSLTQSLTGDGIVQTKDDRGKLLTRRYYLHLPTALEGEDSIDRAVRSVPPDGRITTNFGREVILDLSTEDLELEHRYLPLRLLYNPFEAMTWLTKLDDSTLTSSTVANILTPAGNYAIPAIALDKATSKAAVATVFEKVNTGGLPLNAFELLTAIYSGDRAYYEEHGDYFRLNEDWAATQTLLAKHPVLAGLENTDFLQSVTLAASVGSGKATTARKEDILNLALTDYLIWAPKVRDGFAWAATFLEQQHIHSARDLPYQSQIIPLAVIKVLLGDDSDIHGVWKRLSQWYWCGVLGELYGGSTATRFARDVEQVPAWARASSTGADAPTPRTVEDANFVQSRLHSLRTRNAAAYKGIYALLMAQDTRDWLKNQRFDRATFQHLAVDIHHIFPKAWCFKHGIEDEQRESIVNKTPMGKQTNIKLGGHAPSAYLASVEAQVGLKREDLDTIIAAHQIDPVSLRADDFDAFFTARRDALCALIADAMGKKVSRDLDQGAPEEDSDAFEDPGEDEDPSDELSDEGTGAREEAS